jgi:hypothetical protein
VSWKGSAPELMDVPFVNPQTNEIANFLKTNVENEWRFDRWRLQVSFGDFNPIYTTHIEFKPGVTPNVNALAGNIITMDANTPLTEYNVQWTIRHEYGHTLGFPDCYLEFYDEEARQIVSYQLDISNIMCSRRGHIQATHFNELKRLYFNNKR